LANKVKENDSVGKIFEKLSHKNKTNSHSHNNKKKPTNFIHKSKTEKHDCVLIFKGTENAEVLHLYFNFTPVRKVSAAIRFLRRLPNVENFHLSILEPNPLVEEEEKYPTKLIFIYIFLLTFSLRKAYKLRKCSFVTLSMFFFVFFLRNAYKVEVDLAQSSQEFLNNLSSKIDIHSVRTVILQMLCMEFLSAMDDSNEEPEELQNMYQGFGSEYCMYVLFLHCKNPPLQNQD
jgi:hypothetical protein